MNRKEKYYNFIADDLNDKIEIFHKYFKIGFPWEQVDWFETSDGESFPFGSTDIDMFGLSHYKLSPMGMERFGKYVADNYGVRDEEAEIIYKLFRNKLLPRIGYPGSVKN